MGYTVIAPVGGNPKALFVGMKEFPTQKVFLIAPKNKVNDAQKMVKQLDDFTIKSKIIEITGNPLEEMFRVFGEIVSVNNPDDLIVNVATGDSDKRVIREWTKGVSYCK